MEDELAEKMSSLGRAPEETENPDEVSGDGIGDLDVLRHDMAERGIICKVGINKEGDAKLVSVQGYDPLCHSEIGSDVSVQGVSNSNKHRDARRSINVELVKNRKLDCNFYAIGIPIANVTG